MAYEQAKGLHEFEVTDEMAEVGVNVLLSSGCWKTNYSTPADALVVREVFLEMLKVYRGTQQKLG